MNKQQTNQLVELLKNNNISFKKGQRGLTILQDNKSTCEVWIETDIHANTEKYVVHNHYTFRKPWNEYKTVKGLLNRINEGL